MSDRIITPETDEGLLKECKMTTFRSKERGGQHLNKTESAVRFKHIQTNIITTSQKSRSQYQNQKQFRNKSDLNEE